MFFACTTQISLDDVLYFRSMSVTSSDIVFRIIACIHTQ
jgi:hypothetical protein